MIEPIARIRIELQEIEPKIWRRVDVPLSSTLLALHDFIQFAFRWTDSHLFEFEVGDRNYGEAGNDKCGEHPDEDGKPEHTGQKLDKAPPARNSKRRKTEMKRLVAVAMVMGMVLGPGLESASAEWLQKKRNVSPGEQQNTEPQQETAAEEIWREGDHWQDMDERAKVWNKTLRGWNGVPLEDTYRGLEKRPTKSRIVVLDRPLPKTTGPRVVEVEWFHTPIGSTGNGNIWGSSATTTIRWWTSWLKRDGNGKVAPVKLVFRMVGKGPRMLRVFAPHRRSYQELVYAWGDLEFGTKGMSAFVALSDRAQRARGMRGLSTRLDMESVIRNAAELPASYPRLSVEEWRSLVDREETKERIRVADERYLEMMTKAVKVNRKILKVPQDPMLLIDGKYLLTSPITGKITDLFRTANWVIREGIERMPSYGFKPEEVRWGIERNPKRKELVRLKQPFPAGEGIQIEWLYSYIGPEGQPKSVRWIWDTLWNWGNNLEDEGIELTIIKAPITNGQRWVKEHQRVHQEAVTAWRRDFWLRRNGIHLTLAEYLATKPDGIGNHDEAGKLLEERANINHEIYHAARTGSTSDASELAMLKRKGEMLESVRKRNKTAGGPVFLINGEYVLLTKNVTDAFQSLNWAVRKLREGV